MCVKFHKISSILLLIAVLWGLTACGTFEIGFEEPPPLEQPAGDVAQMVTVEPVVKATAPVPEDNASARETVEPPDMANELQPPNLINQTFANGITLRGFELTETHDSLQLFWQVALAPTDDYTIFVHLFDDQGNLRAQIDSPYPTSEWKTGDTVLTEHPLGDLSLSPGEYSLKVGLYDSDTGRRLTVGDTEVAFGTLKVHSEFVAPAAEINIAELLASPMYNTAVAVTGEVGMLGEMLCPCFSLTSGRATIQVWYDLMVEDDGTSWPALNVEGLQNGDRVTVTGELRASEGTQPSTTLWAKSIVIGETAEQVPAISSTIETVDETWVEYTNHNLGFSIKFPHTMIHFMGGCNWNEEQQSYRPKMGYVPVKVFEDGNTVYISSDYYYELDGERKETSADGGTRSCFAECNMVENNLERLQDSENYPQMMWRIVTREVHGDEELDTFLKERYGKGCKLGEKVPSAQAGVYDVSILGDNKDLHESMCPLNYRTVVKYAPALNKVVAWNTGQAPTFVGDEQYSVTYDEEMVASFRFLGLPDTAQAE